MKYTTLGKTGIEVSRICLGTMTWGEQNTREDGFAQMDMALERGINFFDTAEMYSIPPRRETYGATETIIGQWFKDRGCRDKVVLASKIIGPGFDWVRDGSPKHNRAHIEAALDASLKRLQTDYIDLYQLHWPERKTNFFGKLDYVHDEDDTFTALEETLAVLDEQVKAGKIRAIGLSNETPWGVMKYLALSERLGLARVASIQNPYSLLNRSFEVGLAEVAIREQCGLLAYSPLGFGVLSGKYLGGAAPKGARVTLFPHYARYTQPRGIAATEAYVAIARKHGLDPAQMALAYVNSRPFTTANIIGATSLEQLTSNIESIDLTLSAEVLEEIEAVHNDNPNPAP